MNLKPEPFINYASPKLTVASSEDDDRFAMFVMRRGWLAYLVLSGPQLGCAAYHAIREAIGKSHWLSWSEMGGGAILLVCTLCALARWLSLLAMLYTILAIPEWPTCRRMLALLLLHVGVCGLILASGMWSVIFR